MLHTIEIRKAIPSWNAAADLVDDLESGLLSLFSDAAVSAMGATDCQDGCTVEPDGVCCHGYLSAGRTAGVI